MADVIWRAEALADLRQIRDYIRQFDPGAATRVRSALVACGQSLTTYPGRGRPVAGSSLREMVTVPPYVLTYRVEEDVVHIVELRHGARLPRNRP